MEINDLTTKIRRGEIDCNNQSSFFGILIKGLMWKLNQDISVRNISVPHIILNTGDDTMILEYHGQDQSISPEISNENYIYNIVPRCVVSPKGFSIPTDQLTSPYSSGQFQIDYDDQLVTYNAEFRRMPVKLSVDLQYVTVSYTDFLELVQQIMTKLLFIRNYNIEYMGQSIMCSYKLPDSFDGEHLVEFDEATTDDRKHKLNLTIEVESNLPIYNNKTAIPADKYIRDYQSIIKTIP